MDIASLTRVISPAPTPRTPGKHLEIRPLEPGDSAAVLAVFDGMSPRSRELRFLAPKPRLTLTDLRRLTAVDPRDHIALLATSARGHQPVGIARFVRDPHEHESAEVALAVADRWQNRGVGTTLMEALVQRAVEVGVRRFTALVAHNNAAVLRVLRRSAGGLRRTGIDQWAAEYVLSLEGEPP